MLIYFSTKRELKAMLIHMEKKLMQNCKIMKMTNFIQNVVLFHLLDINVKILAGNIHKYISLFLSFMKQKNIRTSFSCESKR